jgi:hypothetical protein
MFSIVNAVNGPGSGQFAGNAGLDSRADVIRWPWARYAVTRLSPPHQELSRHENRGLDAKHRWPCVVKLVDELERMGHYSAIREKPERIGA